MTRGQRIAVWVGIVMGSVLLLVGLALVVLTRTALGREQVRGFALEQLRGALDGEVEIGRLEGDLLVRWRLVDVSIADPEGRPFIAADTIATGYSLRSLLRRRIVLKDVTLINARVVLDHPPGEKWNYARILPEPGPEPTPVGWGDWIRLEDVVILNGHVTVRSEWKPDDDLSPEQRERKITEALDPEAERANIQRVPGGFQNIMDFRQIDARLGEVLLADPDLDRTEVDVAMLRAIAQPYRPPAADVRALEGRFFISGDSVWFQDVRARLPGSLLAGEGVYHLESADLILHMRGAPAAFDDLRWLYPPFPEEGGGDLMLRVHSGQQATRIEAEDMDVRVRESALTGDLRMVLGEPFRLLPTDLAFANFDSRLLTRMIPALELPRHGTLDGRLALQGDPEAMRVDGDVAFHDARAGRSRVVAAGIVGMGDEIQFADLRLDLQPLRTDLLRDQVPRLPPGAVITGPATLDGTLGGPLRLDADLALDDPATGRSRVLAAGLIDPAPGEIRFAGFQLEFRPLRAGLVRQELPQLPSGATIAGRLALDGSSAGILNIDGALVVTDPATGESRVAAAGGVDLRDEVGFVGLDLRFDPLQLALVQNAGQDLPLGGTLTGTARLDGRPGARLAVRGDLVHVEAGERSRVAGTAELLPGDRARVDVRLLPLSLVTAGRFAPEAALRGEVRGTFQATGALADLSLRADLTVPGGGELVAAGVVDLASDRPGYDLDTRLQGFDLAAVTARAPAATSLSGTIAATGRGIDPGTMHAELSADLVGSAVDGVAADEVRLRAGIADGLARIDSSVVRIGAVEAWADGGFGLVETREGELRYRVAIDSLHAVAPFVPVADTGVAAPRPLVRRAALAEARAEVERAERRRLIEQLATGRERSPEPIGIDTLAVEGVPRDTVAGSLEAEGTLRGNIAGFDLQGSARAEELLLGGQYVGSGWAEYTVLQRGLPEPAIELDMEAEDLMIEGFALDSARAEVRHTGARTGAGSAVIVAYQDDDTDYRADVEFTLGLDRSELVLHDMELRFDTLTWRSTRPGVVSWDGGGVEIDDIELSSDTGGLIFVDGAVPLDGPSDLDLVLRDVELATLAILLQDDSDLRGRVSLEATMEGLLSAPRFEGEATLLDGQRNGQALPDARASFVYDAAELTVDAELFEDGVTFAVAEAVLPIDLALTEREGSRLLGGSLAIDIRTDSLPVDMLPALTEEVRDAEGIIAGDISIRGAWDAVVLEGDVGLNLATFRLASTGVRYEDVAGSIRLDGTTLVVDSLVAWAGGPIRVTGEIDIGTLTEPGFNLEVQVENAWAMRTDDLQLRVDADLEVVGPFDRVVVSGAARTHSSVLYVPPPRNKNVVSLYDPAVMEELEARLRERFEDLIPPPSPLLANLEVEVELEIAPDTWVRSTDYNVEIYTPADVGPLAVRLDQRAGRLTLEGTVNSDRGEYSFMGRRFNVARGSAAFIGGSEINPVLQIVAEHEVQLPGREAIGIRVVIGGTLLDPELTLESDARPPLSNTDLFTFIALGRSAGSLLQQQGSALGGQGGATGDLVGNVAGLMTRQMTAVAASTMLDEFESDMARELGLDVLNIAPADLPSELFSRRFADLLRGTEIEAGRYIGPRFFALARARPTTETRPGGTLEYRTPDGFRFRTTLEPRYLPPEPTLRGFDPPRTSVFGVFILREWRF